MMPSFGRPTIGRLSLKPGQLDETGEILNIRIPQLGWKIGPTWILCFKSLKVSTKALRMKLVISCVVGKSAGVVVGRIATRQFLNAVLFATARL